MCVYLYLYPIIYLHLYLFKGIDTCLHEVLELGVDLLESLGVVGQLRADVGTGQEDGLQRRPRPGHVHPHLQQSREGGGREGRVRLGGCFVCVRAGTA